MHVSIRDPLSIARFFAARAGESVVIQNSDNPIYDVIKRLCTEISLVGRQEGVGPIWRGIKGRNQPIEYPTGNRPFRIVSFHTDDEFYTAAAARLKASADHLSVPVHIETVPNSGSWERDCSFKAQFVHDQWHKLDVPVVWVDADATLNAYPGLFAALDADFAIHKRGGWAFAAGTLYFGRSALAAALLARWVDKCRASPTHFSGDQVMLDHAWAEITRELPLRTFWLPGSYCRKFDQAEAEKAIIVHWQASRQRKTTKLIPKKDRPLLHKTIDHVKRRLSHWARRASRTA